MPLGIRVVLLAGVFAAAALFKLSAQAQTPDEGTEEPAPVYPYIFIANADGSSAWPLTRGLRPSWSPDGEIIQFYREGPVFRQGEMLYMRVDRAYGQLQWGAGIEPTWRPDGISIAFTNTEGIAVKVPGYSSFDTLVTHDFLAAVPTDETGTYEPWDMGVGKPAWSPDGTRIAFEHLGDADLLPARVYLMNADGTDVQPLIWTSGWVSAESDPAWSPDGRRIALWKYGYGLAIVNLWDRIPRTIYQNYPTVAYGANPAWSPDGSTIAFVVNAWRPGERSIWVVDSWGGSPRELIPDAYDPEWSPDGNYIAFVRDLAEPLPQPEFPPLSRPAAVYDRDPPHRLLVDYRTRYVLYPDGTFELQDIGPNGSSYSWEGSWTRTGFEIWFIFGPDPYPEPDAIGVLSSDDRVLDVTYDDYMTHSDFESGTYVLTTEQTPEGPVKEPDEPLEPPIPPPPAECAPPCLPMGDFDGYYDWIKK